VYTENQYIMNNQTGESTMRKYITREVECDGYLREFDVYRASVCDYTDASENVTYAVMYEDKDGRTICDEEIVKPEDVMDAVGEYIDAGLFLDGTHNKLFERMLIL